MIFDFELVGKIGSMALIRKEDRDIDYNIFSRLGAQLRPGYIWVSSGAAEIGRLDFIKRAGYELDEDDDARKTDYAAQGQVILMENYRRFIPQQYGVRQLLVEHQHFNDPQKREYILGLLKRAAMQGAVPIVNYNDAVSAKENRNYELAGLKKHGGHVVECVDNDETASVIADIVKARLLVILTTTEGIYSDPEDKATLIKEISGANINETLEAVKEAQKHCVGASRAGANGAWAKLEYITQPLENGTQVIIGNARYKLSQLIEGSVPRTWIGVR